MIFVDEYDIENLRIRCTDFLISKLNEQSAELIYRLAEFSNLQNVKKSCLNYLQNEVEIDAKFRPNGKNG